jgi:xylulokinase
VTDHRLLAIDVGTSGCKAAVFDSGNALGISEGPVSTIHEEADRAEQNPLDWWSAIRAAVRDVCANTETLRVEGLAISSQSESLVLLGEDGLPLRLSILWMDMRSRSQSDAISKALGEDVIHARSGLRSDATFTASKVLWLRENEPAVFARTRWFMQPKDYLLYLLTGEVVTDPSTASRSLMWDQRDGTWWPEMLDLLGIESRLLPRVAHSHAAIGHLSRQASAELGVEEGALVACGATDRACEALGAAIEGTSAMVSTGTATSVSVARQQGEPSDDLRIVTPAHAIPGETLVQLALPTSGAVFDWFARLLDHAGEQMLMVSLEREANESPLGADGVIALPFFMGSRSVRWDPGARGVIAGLTLGTRRGDIARAIIEGIAFETKACLNLLAATVGPVRELLLLGGAHASPLWCQILADVTQLKCGRPADKHSSLAGAMVLAAAAVGGATDLRGLARRRLKIDRHYRPGPDSTKYQVLYEEYERYYLRAEPVVAPVPRRSFI